MDTLTRRSAAATTVASLTLAFSSHCGHAQAPISLKTGLLVTNIDDTTATAGALGDSVDPSSIYVPHLVLCRSAFRSVVSAWADYYKLFPAGVVEAPGGANYLAAFASREPEGVFTVSYDAIIIRDRIDHETYKIEFTDKRGTEHALALIDRFDLVKLAKDIRTALACP
jgi:hypothetical protein